MIKISRLQITDYRLQMKICFFSLFSVLCFLCSVCSAQTISSTDLIKNAKEYDNKAVSYSGEVIGEIMPRGKFAWINVHDGKNAIGVWIDKDLTKEIQYSGSYKSKGDWIEITGIFHQACSQHGGDLDIHSQTIKVLEKGRLLAHRLNPGKRNFTVALGVILCLILILKHYKKI